MFHKVVRACALLVLASLPAATCFAQVGAVSTFKISSITADDVPGGIYNGSPLNVTVVIRNASTFSGAFQAALSIPAGYAFLDQHPCGGTVQQPPFCRSKAFPGSAYYLLWADGADGMGSGNTLAGGSTSSCTVRLVANTVTSQDRVFATAYPAPHSPCSTNSTDVQNYLVKTTAGPTTDVSIAISSNKTSVAVGDSVDYTLTARNLGRQDASNVQTTFNFPTSLSVAPKNCSGASTTGGPAIGWALATLAYGGSATCVLTATVQSGAGTNAVVTAQTSLPTNTTDTNTSNNSATNTIALVAPVLADLVANIAADKTSLNVGDAVTFTLGVTNGGPQDAIATQLVATFSTDVSLLSASCAIGVPSNPLTWSVGTLTSKTSNSCTVQAHLNTTTHTSITASESVNSATVDPHTSDNTASVSLPVQQSGPAANLAIQLGGAIAGHTYAPGESLHLTVTATNLSSATANNVVATMHVRDSSHLSGLGATCGSFDAGGTLVWTVGSLTGSSAQACNISALVAGGSRHFPVTAKITASNLGPDVTQLMDALIVAVNPVPRRISVRADGAPTARDSSHVVLSRDGATAVFQSQETHLVASNANSTGQDIYRVGADGKPVLETLDNAGHALLGTASSPAISGDGSVVAFSFNNSLGKAAKDAVTGQMWAGPSSQPKHEVDLGKGGAAPNGAASGAPSVSSSGGGKKLVFCSAASNLVPGDTNGANDVFLVDPTNAAQPPQRISTDASGVQLPGDSCEPRISADGTKVVFTISSPTLYRVGARQVVVKDLTTGNLTLITGNTTPAGPGAGADSSEPTLNADGSVVAFTSAYDLDGLGAPVGGKEVFVSLPQVPGAPPVVRRVRSSDGTVPNGSSQHAQLSDDGSVLVMQTLATNFFGSGKVTSGTAACGTVAITMNFFAPAAVGSSLCTGQSANQNPSISGDGTVVGVDSNAPQSGTGSTNSNAYLQGISGLNDVGKSEFDGDFSGQWYDPSQSGQGLVIDVAPAQSNGSHFMSAIWFVYVNGQPTWLLGAALAHAGSGADAGKTVLQMDQVGIFHGISFPIGEAAATPAVWGSMTIVFADANTAIMTWSSTYAGFNSGTMALTHFLPVAVPANDPPGAQVKACYSGNWKEPSKSGHGFEFEIVPSTPPVFVADWFAYGPSGAPVWLQGSGPITGNTAQLQMQLIDGTGAQFPPRFDGVHLSAHTWGTLSVAFGDATHAHAAWNSTIPGYGTGAIDLVPTYGLDHRSCQ